MACQASAVVGNGQSLLFDPLRRLPLMRKTLLLSQSLYETITELDNKLSDSGKNREKTYWYNVTAMGMQVSAKSLSGFGVQVSMLDQTNFIHVCFRIKAYLSIWFVEHEKERKRKAWDLF